MIARRDMLVAAALLLLPGAAMAQQVGPVAVPAPAAPRAARPRPRRPAAQPNPPPAPPTPVTRGDPAPVPNHDMEAPQRSASRATPQINPALIDPVQPQVGTARDGASLQSREDRLLRQPAAGARLRMPFGY